MKFIILFLALSSSIFATNWNLVWSDEFDSNGAPDNTKWNFVTYGNKDDWWNNEDENYTKEDAHNAWVENGNLIIEAKYEKNTWPGDDREKDYTSARLTTKGKGDWTYGKMEIRAKLPAGKGTWPAIWLLASDDFYGGWPKSGEVDIMENLGKDPDIIHGTIHTEAYNHTKGTQKEAEKTVIAPSNDFHTYSVIWTPDTIKIAVDNDYYFSFGNEHNTWEEWPFDKDFHLILNVALGGWGGTVDNSILPQKMYVDYVRVYEDKDLKNNNSSIDNVDKKSVKNISLSVYPNPFNPSTTIIFNSLMNDGKAVIYNILGQKIENLGNIKKGINNFIFNGSLRTSGIYFVKVYQGKFVYTKKIILIK